MTDVFEKCFVGKIIIEHPFEGKFACRKDAGYCGRNSAAGEDIYVFQIVNVKIRELVGFLDDQRFDIYIRGEHTCWMCVDNFYVHEEEEGLLDYVQREHEKELLKPKTYVIGYGLEGEY